MLFTHYLKNRCHSLIRILTFSILLASSLLVAQAKTNFSPIILSGKIEAGDTQKFTVPWSQTWRQQIKWMKPEGEFIRKGELAIVFESGDSDSQIEQLEAQLIQTKETANNNRQKNEVLIINAEHDLIKAQLRHKLATTMLDTPLSFRSQFEIDNLAFDLEKSTKELVQARLKLKIALGSQKADVDKQIISIKKIQSQLNNNLAEKEKLQLRATRDGTILHANHPWNGSKIAVGQSVQTSWTISTIPSSGSEYIRAWINEVDFPKIAISQKTRLTLDAYFDHQFRGEISSIAQQSESKTDWGNASYYSIKIKFINRPPVKLIPGMSVRIEIQKDIDG